MAPQYDINDEDIGIRAFQLRKERALEQAMEKLRHSLGAEEWSKISFSDSEVLKWALGETWALMGFDEWGRIPFSKMGLDSIQKIIEIGKEITSHKKMGARGLEEVHNILKSLG